MLKREYFEKGEVVGPVFTSHKRDDNSLRRTQQGQTRPCPSDVVHLAFGGNIWTQDCSSLELSI